MIGRAAQGRPWIFREIAHFLATGRAACAAAGGRGRRALLEHLHDHYSLYGEYTGVRSARKHIGWYLHGNCPAATRSASRMLASTTARGAARRDGRLFDALARARTAPTHGPRPRE
jgi:tRNA-dihydrouridine synthase B